MMKLLLDTHIAIWFIMDDNRLPQNVKQHIQDTDDECYLSIASLWEIGIKHSIGRIKLKAELKKIFELFFESGFTLLPITPDHILTNITLPFKHRDPFDRMIIAQAKREGFHIISKDKNFSFYDINLLWDDA